ncbi:protein VACUOLELESS GAMETOPHYTES-like [Solanum dulcamara]|uniref:protein VACUOLELESS GAMETOPHYTES-like n=1 Tax=Solanum dulcamara TaxID=45834 RepID=UPI00248590F3|nr:protein VACUOLELESS GAMETOPHYTES-like [Solanum dulcamara]
MNARSSHKTVINSDDDNDGKHLIRQPRPVNDISMLIKMMTTMINHNQRGGAGAGRSQLTTNLNRSPVVDYSDSSTDDEGLTQHYYGKIKHFSHPHNLNKYNFQQHSKTNCKVCGLQLVGSGYGCENCRFYVHASCFDLPQKIQHDAHPAHPLTLRYPSYYKHCGKTCDACSEDIEQSFLYCCDICHFDLHVTCTTLYSIVKRPDASTFRLYYTFPTGDSYVRRYCNVCYKKVSKEGWLYYNKDSSDVAHINCAKGKLEPSWIKERLNMLKIK